MMPVLQNAIIKPITTYVYCVINVFSITVIEIVSYYKLKRSFDAEIQHLNSNQEEFYDDARHVIS